MHYDEIIEPIWDKVIKYRHNRFMHIDDERDAIKASMYWALCDSFDQLYVEERVAPAAIEYGGQDLINHIKEKQGYEIGKLINENPSVYHEQDMGERWFKTIKKTVVVLKLSELLKK